ncbi:hypothetical protein ANCCAN_24187 [Ancylostoma caninum]|uniref:G-protein coupled receptors family 1 profile domain-containing protein n=1 Tax=Ancylostoma caninum TaxID=29170 RepID=A0A368FD17_ANCCA|nr:hypothetical protein ANCCAN_24187 [Ancylostoma caninum]
MEWLIRYGGNAEDIPGYDCKLSDRQPGAKNYIIGSAFIIYGLFAEFIYMLDVTVMLKKKHRRLSCYKIMIVLGIYDMAAISLNSLLTGYFWIKGANYCTNPTLMFVAGTAALGNFSQIYVSPVMVWRVHELLRFGYKSATRRVE